MSSEDKIVTGHPFFPHQMLREMFAGLLLLGILILLATFLPAPLLEEADPFVTPSPIFPEWYFMPMFGVLKFWVWGIGPLPAKFLGVFLPGLVIGLIILLPFIDRNPKKKPLERPVATSLGILLVLIALYFSYYAIRVTLAHV